MGLDAIHSFSDIYCLPRTSSFLPKVSDPPHPPGPDSISNTLTASGTESTILALAGEDHGKTRTQLVQREEIDSKLEVFWALPCKFAVLLWTHLVTSWGETGLWN